MAELKRELGLVDVFSITAGSMISAGLFLLPGIAFNQAGPAVILSYLLSGMLAFIVMLSAAELITAMPKAGGVYYFISRGAGFPAGSVAGFARWFAISLNSAFALLGIGVYAVNYTNIPLVVIATACGLFFITINLLGINLVGRVQRYLLFGLIALLSYYVFSGLPAIRPERFIPFLPHGPAPVLSTAGFIFISYGGLLVITGLAEEVKKPDRNIPRGMLLSIITVGLLYVFTVLVTVGVMDPAALGSSLTPISDGARVFLGLYGAVLIIFAAFLALVTTANAGIASASRYPLAMSRDGLLPSFFQRVDPHYAIPRPAILVTGAFITLVILFIRLDLLVNVASTLLIITYIMTNITLLLVRKRGGTVYKPGFRAPFYPWLQITGTVGLFFVLFLMGILPLLFSVFFILAALVWYYWRRQKTVDS
ncbi:MAG: APC family permease [Bacillota bacterium]